MMIDVTVANTDVNLTELYTHMNPLVAGATLLWSDKDQVVLGTGVDNFVITGTDLIWQDGALQGGMVDALTLRRDGIDLIRFASLNVTGDRLWAAMLDEQAGTDPAALTHLLVRHCWTYHGSTGVDYFPETTLEPFGWLNPTGNDRVYLESGDDIFFTGSAKDTVFGGAGNDQIAGGTENDRLVGGSGSDGLSGDSGNDALYGGTRVDLLTGGSGDDLMRGGSGADVFEFDATSGHDVIEDYQAAFDHLQIAEGLTVTVVDQGENTLVQFGESDVLLLGVTADQLTAGDFL